MVRLRIYDITRIHVSFLLFNGFEVACQILFSSKKRTSCDYFDLHQFVINIIKLVTLVLSFTKACNAIQHEMGQQELTEASGMHFHHTGSYTVSPLSPNKLIRTAVTVPAS